MKAKSEVEIIVDEGKILQIFKLGGFEDLMDEKKKWEILDSKIALEVPSFISPSATPADGSASRERIADA